MEINEFDPLFEALDTLFEEFTNYKTNSLLITELANQDVLLTMQTNLLKPLVQKMDDMRTLMRSMISQSRTRQSFAESIKIWEDPSFPGLIDTITYPDDLGLDQENE